MIKEFILSILLFAFCIEAVQSQDIILKAEDNYPPPPLIRADSLFKQRAYSPANDELDLVLQKAEKQNDKRLLVAALEMKARAYRRLDDVDYTMAFPFIERAVALARDNLSADDLLLSRVYITLGRFYYRTFDFFSAREILDTTMMLYNNASTTDQELYEDIIDYKYYTYFNSNGSTDTLLTYVNLRYLRELNKVEKNEAEILYILQDFPDMYIDIGDYERALTYAIQGYRYAEENRSSILKQRDGFETYANSFKNLMDVLLYRKDYKEALNTGMKLLEAINREGVSINDYDEYYAVIGNIGLIYNRMENYEEALKYFRESLKIGKDDPLKTIFYGRILLNIGNCLINLGNEEDGLRAYYEGLGLLKQEIEMPSVAYHQPFNDIGAYYESQRDYKRALLNYDSALNNALPNNKNAWYEFPSDTTQDLSLDQLSTVAYKGALFDKILIDSLKREDLYRYGLNYADKIHNILLNRRQEFEATEGKLFLSEEFRFVYESAIEMAYYLYQGEPKEEYFLEALKFSRLSKSILFLEQSAEYEKVNNNILDQELKRSFSHYKKQLEQLEGTFYALIDNDVTSDSIGTLNESLSVLRVQLNNVLDTIEQELAAANCAGMDGVFTQNLMKIQQERNTVQVEYFYGKESVYVLGIGPGENTFHRIVNDARFENKLAQVVEYVASPPRIDSFDEEQAVFARNAHYLYKELLKPVLDELPNLEQIVVVPDQLLSRLPFEVLIEEFDPQDRLDEMAFLIKNYSIRYRLSSLLEDQNRSGSAKRSVLGLGYSNGSAVEGYSNLPGTENEINFLKASYQGVFINSASKDQFLDLSGDFDILHLAVHGASDTVNKYDSRLIFSSGDEPELKTSDLYLAGLNARLAVLSACESGLGAMNKGEGTFSIARGFALSGVPSVVMSLWKVNDKVTSKLMQSMYKKFIEDAENINASLQLAKKEYLQNADTYFSHPFYWASFIHLGEDLTFKKTKSYGWIYIFALAVVALLLFYTTTKKRKRVN